MERNRAVSPLVWLEQDEQDRAGHSLDEDDCGREDSYSNITKTMIRKIYAKQVSLCFTQDLRGDFLKKER